MRKFQKYPSALGVHPPHRKPAPAEGWGQGRKGRGQAWSVRAPTRAAAPSFPLGRGRRKGFEGLLAVRARRQRPRARRPALRREKAPRSWIIFLFPPGTRLRARVYRLASGPSGLCVPPPGVPIPVSSAHCWAQPSGRRGRGLRVIPGGHLPLPNPVDAASSSPPCFLLNRIL